jgi:hypothetical protein
MYIYIFISLISLNVSGPGTIFFNIHNTVDTNIQAVLISNNQIMNYTQNIYEKKIVNNFNNNTVNRYKNSGSIIRGAYIYDGDAIFKKYANNMHIDVHIIGNSSLVVRSDYFSIDQIIASGGGVVTAESYSKIGFLNKFILIENVDFRMRNGSIDLGI